MCCMCTRTCAQREREREVQMPAYDSILRDHIDANEANARHVIARVEDPRSAGWMLSCQWLIPSASHRFLFFFFFSKTWFPYLPKALESSHLSFPISPSSSSSSANLSLPAQAGMMQITEKRQMSQPNTHVMGRNPLVSSLLCYSRLSPENSSHSSLISSISDTCTASIFFLFFFFCAFLLLRTSHHCQRITHFGLSDVWAACFLHLLLWEFQTFFMQACIWREIKACVMALWCATNLPIWCKSKAQWSLSLGGKRLWWKGFWGGELHTVHQY